MAFTFFFRDLHVLRLLAEHLVPSVMGRSYVRVWDAGCAMGPEPYSLAIVLAERMGQFAFNNLRIHATDIDECGTFGNTIVESVYPVAELERIPEDLRERYFEPSGPGTARLISRIRNAVRFERHDLLSLRPVATGFSMVMCKNVLLHFSAQQRIEVIRMFYQALASGGLLVMEQTQKLPEELAGCFERVAHDGQLFRKIEAA